MTRTAANMTALTLALCVALLAVAAPWFLSPRCTEMTAGSMRGNVAMGACDPVGGDSLTATCDGMRPGSSAPAATVAKTTFQPEIASAALEGRSLPDAGARHAVVIAWEDPPPRPALDISPLRI